MLPTPKLILPFAVVVVLGVVLLGETMKIPIPTDWNGVDTCRWAVCWPSSPQWKAILFGLLSSPSQGRYWDEETGNIRNTQALFRPFYTQNFDLSEVIMACNDINIADALNAIAVALAAQTSGGGAGCGCSGGSTSTIVQCLGTNLSVNNTVILPDGTTWPVFSTTPVPTLPPSGFPDGYPDEGAYLTDKCAKATKIIDDLIATLNQIGLINWGSGVIGAAIIIGALVGAITVPYVVIPLLLFALTANIGITALLIQSANYIEANKQDFICILYETDTVDEIIQLISSALVTMVAFLGVSGAIAVAIKGIILWLLNGDVLGLLFDSSAAGQYPSADCDFCAQECPILFDWQSNSDALGFTFNTLTTNSTVQVGADTPNYYTIDRLFGGGANWRVEFMGALETPHVVSADDRLDWRAVLSDTSTFYVGVRTAEHGDYWHSGGLFPVGGAGTLGGGPSQISTLITAPGPILPGETITHVGFMMALSPDAARSYSFDYMGINCPLGGNPP